MKLSEETKQLIHKEFAAFKEEMYNGLTLEERKKYGMVYTPADISIQMIEKFNCTNEEFANKAILDPTCGSGNLLVACLLAGADATKIYGNELNKKMVRLARRRIRNLCENVEEYPNIKNREAWVSNNKGGKFNSNSCHIHIGDATKKICLTYFCSDYPQKLGEELRGLLGFCCQTKFEDDLVATVEADEKFEAALDTEHIDKTDYEEISTANDAND